MVPVPIGDEVEHGVGAPVAVVEQDDRAGAGQGVGALVLANLVAAVPGRIAARTPTALVLRAD